MDRCSYFIPNKALFGSFPTQESVDELEEAGVRYFINLTNDNEARITPYNTQYTYIHYPIPDRHVPKNWNSFAKLIIRIADIIHNLQDNELIYCNCRGGHGRSGLLVACLLCYIQKLNPADSIALTTKYHNDRKEMNPKWRSIGSPQTRSQKTFVYKFFEPLYFYRAHRSGQTAGFSNFSNHHVTIPDFGTFPTSESAIQAYKRPDNTDYVKRQQESRTPINSRGLGNKIIPTEYWYNNRECLMYHILECKFDQHEDIKRGLLNTGFRPIIQHTRSDTYWGCGQDNNGSNVLGKLLVDLREKLYRV